MKKRITTWALAAGLACISGQAADDKKAIKLFNGKDLNNWMQQKPRAWEAKDGVLGPSSSPGGYIWAKGSYENFELELDFKMSKRCNSGVFFRTDPKNAVQGGFEIQILDSNGKSSVGTHDCGALYDALAPSANAAKPSGEWNHMKLTVNGPSVKVVLNGKQVIVADLDQWTKARKNPDGSRNKFRTALKDLPRTGSIGLQYHGHPVWFKNIFLKPL
ncbi:MAG: DUF1080 domain-containing protein [Verrucomicrobiota bacterium]|jgi:hypothetical protein|nr:DUF1080 domain-containing protein [Verrucomicrobiota bacterium]MDP7048375.1 DUF1080 domain-containing protein [Verrucomicrobiota bacterium]